MRISDWSSDVCSSDLAISVHEEGVYSRIATALGTGSPTNGGGYSSPEMDALIQELQGKKTPEDAKDVLTRIEALYAKDVPALTISSGAMVDIWQKNVHGIKGTGETIVLLDRKSTRLNSSH